MLGSVGL